MLRAGPEFKDTRPPGVQHVDGFGGHDKEITLETMKDLFYSIGDSYQAAVDRANRVDFGAVLKGVKCPFAKLKFSAFAGLGFMHDPDHSGIIKKDGTLDEDLLQKLKDSAEEYYGKNILTEKITDEFVRGQMLENQKNYKSTNCLSAMFRPCIRKGGEKASKGEFKGLWELFPRNKTVDGVAYLTDKEIDEFYRDPKESIRKLQAIVRQERTDRGEPLTFAEAEKAYKETHQSKCWNPFRMGA